MAAAGLLDVLTFGDEQLCPVTGFQRVLRHVCKLQLRVAVIVHADAPSPIGAIRRRQQILRTARYAAALLKIQRQLQQAQQRQLRAMTARQERIFERCTPASCFAGEMYGKACALVV